MTLEGIQARRQKEVEKFETARQIRELLNSAREAHGPADWDENDIEAEIIALVTDDDE